MSDRRGEAGQVLPLVAICLVVLMGFAGMAVDVGYLQYQQRAQQSATDAAAIAGARQLVFTGCPNQATASAAALADASTNGYTNGAGSVTVTPVNAPLSGAFAADPCAVQVQIYSPHRTFFSKLFGTALIGDETTQAVATLTTNAAACMYLLDPDATWNVNGGSENASNCAILINGTAAFNGGTVRAQMIGYGGSRPSANGTSFPQASPAPMLRVADPCPQISGCAYLAANPPTIPTPATPPPTCSPGSLPAGFRGGALAPGCYNNPSFTGGSAVVMTGNYTLINPSFTGVPSVTMSGGSSNVFNPSFNGINTVSFSGGNYTITSPDFNGGGSVSMAGGTFILTGPSFNGGTNIAMSGSFFVEGASNFNGTNITQSGSFVYSGGNSSFNGATLKDDASGNGTTIYTASGGAPNFNGATLKLTPTQTGPYAGVLYYQVPANTNNPHFNGGSNSISGLFYAPGADDVDFNGANGGYTVLVFGSANYNGSESNIFGPPVAGQPLVRRAVLAQ